MCHFDINFPFLLASYNCLSCCCYCCLYFVVVVSLCCYCCLYFLLLVYVIVGVYTLLFVYVVIVIVVVYCWCHYLLLESSVMTLQTRCLLL